MLVCAAHGGGPVRVRGRPTAAGYVLPARAASRTWSGARGWRSTTSLDSPRVRQLDPDLDHRQPRPGVGELARRGACPRCHRGTGPADAARARTASTMTTRSAVAAQRESFRDDILRYRNHPALLAWIVGNELNHGLHQPRVFDAVEDVAGMIRELDRITGDHRPRGLQHRSARRGARPGAQPRLPELPALRQPVCPARGHPRHTVLRSRS